MANLKQRNRPPLSVNLLESRDCPAVFPPIGTLANGDVTGLNNAIIASNANSSDDVINLFPGGTYTLTAELGGVESGNGLTAITADTRGAGTARVRINSNGATIQRSAGVGLFRLLNVEAGAFLELNDATLRNGFTPQGRSGGAILVEGGVDVRNSLFRDNTAGGGGGAIAFAVESGESFLWNSTFSGNSNTHSSESGGGGAIHVSDASDKVTITNCTIAFNINMNLSGQRELSFYGGGLRSNGNAELVNSILSNNSGNGFPNDLAGDLGPGVDFQARNSIIREYGQGRGDEIRIAGPNNLLDTANDTNNPRLRPLADNGGQSFTHSIMSNSAAINAGDNFFSPPSTFDQRGRTFARRVGPRIDIGAYEFKANNRLVLKSSSNPSRVGAAVTFTATMVPDNKTTPRSGTVTFTIDGRVFAPVPVDSLGRATISVSGLARGRHVVLASYSDTVENLFDAASASLIQTVGAVSRRYDR